MKIVLLNSSEANWHLVLFHDNAEPEDKKKGKK